jgi:diguanylate cyclase (GGDEF)-like protein
LSDEVLKEVSNVLRTNVRPLDHPCRKSGDEFLVLLPGVEHDEALEIGNKLEKLVASSLVHDSRTRSDISFTISYGVGTIRREEIGVVADAFKLLIKRADVIGPDSLKSRRKYRRGSSSSR